MNKMFGVLLLCFCSLGVFARQSGNSITWRQFVVPLEISTRQVINSVPEDWSVINDSTSSRLSGVTIYDGFPEENASLVYYKELNKKRTLVLLWTFSGKEKNGIWIVCRYSGTSMQIKKQLPAGIKELRITFDKTIKLCGEPIIQRIEYN
jgi:hypothetical protein